MTSEVSHFDDESSLSQVTDERLREGADKVIGMFCNKFTVDGLDKLKSSQEKNPNAKFIIVGSHTTNLDAPAAVKALGGELKIQITAESLSLESAPHKLFFFEPAGMENFTPLGYSREGGGKHGVFDPQNFNELAKRMDEGKSPWIAIHGGPGTVEKAKRGTMQKPKIGAVYLAHKTGSIIIPTALELDLNGEPLSLETASELARGLWAKARGKGEAVFHIGEPIDLPSIDIGIIENVFEKRARGEKLTKEEISLFSETHQLLLDQADKVSNMIASMLPEKQRAGFKEKKSENI